MGPLLGFWLDVEQQAVGSSKTATVEIISSASLNNDEISLLLEYQGTAGSSLAQLRHQPAGDGADGGRRCGDEHGDLEQQPGDAGKAEARGRLYAASRRPGARASAAREGLGHGLCQSRDHDHLMVGEAMLFGVIFGFLTGVALMAILL